LHVYFRKHNSEGESPELEQCGSCFSIEPNLAVILEEDGDEEEKLKSPAELEISKESSVINMKPFRPQPLLAESTSQLSLASFSPNSISKDSQHDNTSVTELLELTNRKSRSDSRISSESLDAKLQKCLQANKGVKKEAAHAEKNTARTSAVKEKKNTKDKLGKTSNNAVNAQRSTSGMTGSQGLKKISECSSSKKIQYESIKTKILSFQSAFIKI